MRFDVVEVMDSPLPSRDLRLVIAWAELHQELLLENWTALRAGGMIRSIEPLR